MNITKISENQRIEQMLCYEKACYESGIDLICGVDEAGRGSLAGPVVAAAVILPRTILTEGIDDSKKLREKNREIVYNKIMKEAVSTGVGIVDVETIERINILNATKLAMKYAIEDLEHKPQHILVDGNFTIPDILYQQQAIIKGDAKSITIAAASIIAKVTRDNIMRTLHTRYPQYYFDKNKGYGTKQHIAAILENKICPIHRKSFLKRVTPT